MTIAYWQKKGCRMAKVDLARRAEIGRERRERTRTLIVDAGMMLLADRPREALTVDAVVEAAGVAKGTFYYHFQSIDELAAAVGEKLGESFDALLTPARLELKDPVERLSFAFSRFLEQAISDPDWARLVVQISQSPTEFAPGIRSNLKADIVQAFVQGRVSVAGRRAGGRHRDRYMAAGDTRHSGARRPARIDTRDHRGGASRAWFIAVGAAGRQVEMIAAIAVERMSAF